MADNSLKAAPSALVQHLLLRPVDGIDEAIPQPADIGHGAIDIGIVGQADGDVVVVGAGAFGRHAGRQRQAARQQDLLEGCILAAQPRDFALERGTIFRRHLTRPTHGALAAQRDFAGLRIEPDKALGHFVERIAAAIGVWCCFVGKDWRRKGLPFLLAVRAELERRGVRAEVHCAGHGPADLGRQAGVVFTGFIDKAREPGRFLEFLTGCDLGCLFSTHEPLGISTLEFLRAGVPVCGFAVEGLADTLPPDAGFRFAPHATASEVAETLQAAYRDDAVVERLRSAAQVWSPLVTWERCIGEWTELLEHGCIAHPVQPWRGIAPRGNPRRDLSRLDPSGLGGAVATFSSESGTQTDHEN